ncbi:MAG: acylphosphatase, partial [Erysipelotrichaceae bacterium]|nr:acylphosphatase [Erysipelotrichaceae bacterium]
MKRYYVIFEGQVQGVGFRWVISRLASLYNLTGWVRNRDDGRVD